MKTLTLVAFNRVDVLRETLKSLSACRRINEYVIFAVVDWSDCQYEIQSELEAFSEGKLVHIVLNRRTLGVNYNNLFAYQLAFGAGSQFNVAVEDDTVLSPDALVMAEWAWSHWPVDVLAFCAYNQVMPHEPSPNPFELARNNLFNAWGWACPVRIFRRFIEPNWMCFQRWWKGNAQVWDRSLTQIAIDYHMTFVRPVLSRSRHIGMTGCHTSPTSYAASGWADVLLASEPYDEASYYISQAPAIDHAEVLAL